MISIMCPWMVPLSNTTAPHMFYWPEVDTSIATVQHAEVDQQPRPDGDHDLMMETLKRFENIADNIATKDQHTEENQQVKPDQHTAEMDVQTNETDHQSTEPVQQADEELPAWADMLMESMQRMNDSMDKFCDG